MSETEQILNEIWEIQELGQKFTFTVMELRTLKLNKNNKAKKLWLLVLAAPKLEKLREGYGLPSRLKDHDFHLTIGTLVPEKTQIKAYQVPLEESEEFKEAA